MGAALAPHRFAVELISINLRIDQKQLNKIHH